MSPSENTGFIANIPLVPEVPAGRGNLIVSVDPGKPVCNISSITSCLTGSLYSS